MMIIRSLVLSLLVVCFTVHPINEATSEEQLETAIARYLAEAKGVNQELAERLAALATEYNHGLIVLAIMAVESGYNDTAISAKGAVGLAQIMANIHLDPFEVRSARGAGRPNLIDDCGITTAQDLWETDNNFCAGATIYGSLYQRRGSVETALRDYVGNRGDIGKGYAKRVLAEHEAIMQAVLR